MKAKEQISIAFSEAFPRTGIKELDLGIQAALQLAWVTGFDHAKGQAAQLALDMLMKQRGEPIDDRSVPTRILGLGENNVQ